MLSTPTAGFKSRLFSTSFFEGCNECNWLGGGICFRRDLMMIIISCICYHFSEVHYGKYIENFTTKKGIFFIKNSDIFHISVQNIDCGYSLEPPRRGGSNEYPQSMFLSRNNENNVYSCKPQFYYIKVGFKRVKII